MPPPNKAVDWAVRKAGKHRPKVVLGCASVYADAHSGEPAQFGSALANGGLPEEPGGIGL